MIILCNILLPSDRAHAILADIGKVFKPIPVIKRFIEVDGAPIITIVSTDSNIVFGNLKILHILSDSWFFL